jgi:hypothetical protein
MLMVGCATSCGPNSYVILWGCGAVIGVDM